jgi:hypothetical protein
VGLSAAESFFDIEIVHSYRGRELNAAASPSSLRGTVAVSASVGA